MVLFAELFKKIQKTIQKKDEINIIINNNYKSNYRNKKTLHTVKNNIFLFRFTHEVSFSQKIILRQDTKCKDTKR